MKTKDILIICVTAILLALIIGAIIIKTTSYYNREVEACVVKGYSWNYKADKCFNEYKGDWKFKK